MQAHRPGEPSSSPTVATRVQTPCAPPSAFACRLPMATPAAPRTARSPTPFRAPCPPARPLSMGRGHRSAPRAPSPLFHNERRRTARCPFRLSRLLYIYTRARRALSSAGREGAVCPAEGKAKGGEENARGGEQFLHRVDKPVENKLWISGNRCAFSTARHERRRSGGRDPS